MLAFSKRHAKYIVPLALIIGIIAAGFSPSDPNVHYPDKGRHQLLKDTLKKEGISYEEKVLSDGNEYVFWTKQNDKKVRKIMKVIESSH